MTITINITETTMLTVNAEAREMIDILYTMVLVFRVSVFTWNVSLILPVMFPQTTVCMANMHALLSAGIPVQVILVWLVVVGQLPQFDARML